MVCPALPIDMGDSKPLNGGSYSFRQPTVKVEPVSLDSVHSLLSRLPSPSRSSSNVRHSATSPPRCKRKTSYTSPTRGDLSIMTHPYGTWSPKADQIPVQGGYASGMQSSGSNRRGGSGDEQSYRFPDSYSQQDPYGSGDARHPSASTTSSLSNAMGGLGMSPHSPTSPSGMAWTPSPTSGFSGSWVVVPGEGNITPYIATPNTPLHSESSSNTFLPYQPYNPSYPSNPSRPVGMPSPSEFSDFAYAQSVSMMQPRPVISSSLSSSPLNMAMPISPPPTGEANIPIRRSSRPSPDRFEGEIRLLTNKVHELELINKSARDRIRELEHEVARVGYGATARASSSSGLPSPAASPPNSASFNDSWRARTEARTRLFCSLNRAGNALCAWHDSRRERRAYPPRMAPPGHLNCGCSHEEALFEESLARHGVGSYHPGENVRMDPALRNPLLKLLQQRYNYRDGDFERNSLTGDWLEGEGPMRWESKAASGVATIKKNRSDERR